MKILVAYVKFNPRGRGGSDVYLLGLCRSLVDLGHDLTLVTTTSTDFIHREAFSLKWLDDYDASQDKHVPFKVVRFPVTRQIPDFLRHQAARFIMRHWEQEDHREGALQPHSPLFPEFSLRQADSRSPLADRLHAYTIGPNSAPMRDYLFQHAHEYDCLIGGFFPFTTLELAALAAKKAGRPCFIAPLWHSEDRYHYFRHLFQALRQATGIICETHHTKQLLERLIPGSACVEAGIGVTPQYLLPPEGEMPGWAKKLKDEGKKILLYVGRKEPSKNYLVLLEALRQLADPTVTLVMIGRDVDRQPIEQPNVMLLENVDDAELRWAYEVCDLFLFPSLKESFGIVILEAWAAQKPVVGHKRCAAVSSLIDDKVNGILCDSAEEWRLTIQRLLGDPQLTDLLGQKGHQTVLAHYTWKIVGAKVSDFIQERLSARGH